MKAKTMKTWKVDKKTARQIKRIVRSDMMNQPKKPTTEIFEYIRRNKGGITRKVGVIWGTVDKGTIKVGWSKCNEKLGDKFDSLLGLQYAMKRAMKPDGIPTPMCIKSQLRKFGARSVRYFQDATKLELPA